MTALEQTVNDSLRALATTPGPCITLVLGGNEAGDTAIELKDAITSVRQKLEERGADAGELIRPIAQAAAEHRGETKASGAIVILRSPAVMQIHRVKGLRPLVRVDDRFDLRTLLATLAAAAQRFYILALSQKRARILKCTLDSSEELPFPAGFPTSLAEASQTRQPDHNLDNRASGGPSIGAGHVLFGTSSGQDDKDEYMLHYFMDLDKAANTVLKGDHAPLIPAGVEHELALYRRVNSYPHLVEPGIHGAPDGLEGGELHRRALELLQQRTEQPGQAIPGDFDKKIGTGRASTHIQEIITAAYQGRVAHLFLQPDATYLGTHDTVRQRVKHTEDPADSPVDLIESAAYQTILQGGEVTLLPGAAMPNGVPVCALFRYPATS